MASLSYFFFRVNDFLSSYWFLRTRSIFSCSIYNVCAYSFIFRVYLFIRTLCLLVIFSLHVLSSSSQLLKCSSLEYNLSMFPRYSINLSFSLIGNSCSVLILIMFVTLSFIDLNSPYLFNLSFSNLVSLFGCISPFSSFYFVFVLLSGRAFSGSKL